MSSSTAVLSGNTFLDFIDIHAFRRLNVCCFKFTAEGTGRIKQENLLNLFYLNVLWVQRAARQRSKCGSTTVKLAKLR